MPNGDRQYVPIVDGSIQVPKDADNTHLITFSGDTPIVHPSSKLLTDIVNGKAITYQSDYVPELP
jgi:hypothetical protein